MFAELVVDCVVVGLIGGLLSLDRTGAFQVMISRPLVSAPLIGLVLGESTIGLSAGVLIELLYMADRPVGGYMPTHETALAVLVTAVSAAFMAGSGLSSGAASISGLSVAFTVVALVLLVSIFVAPIFRMSDAFSRRMNEKLFIDARAMLDSGSGSSAAVKGQNLKGLFNFFWPVAAMLFISVLLLSLAAFIIGTRLGGLSTAKFYPAMAGFLILALALALNAIKGRGTLIVFSVSGFLTALIWVAIK